jgi:hypothetical protein
MEHHRREVVEHLYLGFQGTAVRLPYRLRSTRRYQAKRRQRSSEQLESGQSPVFAFSAAYRKEGIAKRVAAVECRPSSGSI